MIQRSKFLAQYGVAIAFCVLAFFGGWAIKASADRAGDSLRVASINSCERVNVLRRTFAEFLIAAESARRAEGDIKTADKYAEQFEALKGAEFTPGDSVEVDCLRAYPPL